MNGWVWFLTAGLAVVIMVLLLKIYLLKKSGRPGAERSDHKYLS